MKKHLDPMFIDIFGYDSVQGTIEKKSAALPDIPTLDTPDTDVKKASHGWFRPAQQVEHEQLLGQLAPLDRGVNYQHILGLSKSDEEQGYGNNGRLAKRAGNVSRKAYLSKKFDSYYRNDIRTKFNQAIEQLAKQTHLSGDALNAEFLKLIQ